MSPPRVFTWRFNPRRSPTACSSAGSRHPASRTGRRHAPVDNATGDDHPGHANRRPDWRQHHGDQHADRPPPYRLASRPPGRPVRALSGATPPVGMSCIGPPIAVSAAATAKPASRHSTGRQFAAASSSDAAAALEIAANIWNCGRAGSARPPKIMSPRGCSNRRPTESNHRPAQTGRPMASPRRRSSAANTNNTPRTTRRSAVR